MVEQLIDFIKMIYGGDRPIALHEPSFSGKELEYVSETIKSTFVSSVGKFVDDFELRIQKYTKSPRAVASVNGTSALHATLIGAGIQRGEIVITQALTFVATCNAIVHAGAEPIFVDISKNTLGMSPIALENFLEQHAFFTDNKAYLKDSKKRIKAVMPMHTYGHPVELDELLAICKKWNLLLIEDAAESLGSFYKGKHTGTLGDYGILSFNGNKVITTGGGGMILCSTSERGELMKHLTTTAKVSHAYEFYHDQSGFNYRMPNINAALGCAQIEHLEQDLINKRRLAMKYKDFFQGTDFLFVDEPVDTKSNFWLNSIICPSKKIRDEMLKQTNQAGVMTRPPWVMMNKLPMFKDYFHGTLEISEDIESRLINLPSSPTRDDY